jgi:hypothetical protein
MDGTSVDITLQDVLYIPKLIVNVFSLTKAIETKGAVLSGKGQLISLTLGNTEIVVDKFFKHGLVPLLGIEVQIKLLPLRRLWTSMLCMNC